MNTAWTHFTRWLAPVYCFYGLPCDCCSPPPTSTSTSTSNTSRQPIVDPHCTSCLDGLLPREFGVLTTGLAGVGECSCTAVNDVEFVLPYIGTDAIGCNWYYTDFSLCDGRPLRVKTTIVRLWPAVSVRVTIGGGFPNNGPEFSVGFERQFPGPIVCPALDLVMTAPVVLSTPGELCTGANATCRLRALP